MRDKPARRFSVCSDFFVAFPPPNVCSMSQLLMLPPPPPPPPPPLLLLLSIFCCVVLLQIREGQGLRVHPHRAAPTPARHQQLPQRDREGAGGEAGRQQCCAGARPFSFGFDTCKHMRANVEALLCWWHASVRLLCCAFGESVTECCPDTCRWPSILLVCFCFM